jgi:ribosome-associated toxin RatA of RatAB toxin-antitoxin module
VSASTAEQSLDADATPEACFAAIAGFAAYPEWSSNVESVDVLEQDAESTVVEFRVDAKVRKVRYVLRYFFERPTRVWWEYVEGDVKSVEGEYRFEPLDEARTRMTYRLTMDPGTFLPGPIKKVLVNSVMRGSVEDLKRHVESLP